MSKPIKGRRYKHRNGGVYLVLMLTNEMSCNTAYAPTVVYETQLNGNVWSRPIFDWDRSFTLIEE